MFKSSKKSKIIFNPDKKIEDKISQDFVTHNMPESHRFSGQTFSGQNTQTSNKIINVPVVASHHKIGLLIIGGGLILVASLFYFGYSYIIVPYLNPVPVPVEKINKIVSENPVVNLKAEEPVKIIEVASTSPSVISTSTSETPTSTELILPEERPVVSAPIIVSTVDSDADGLTDNEEKIVGTDPNKADTDNDGYTDLAELKSGYDSLVPDKKISQTSKILNYQIDSKTTIIYPVTWDITNSAANNTVVLADSDKAFIQVVYQDNPKKLSPQAWFEQEFSGVTSGEKVSGSSWQGFYSQDGLVAYIFNSNLSTIYIFSCTPLTTDTSSVVLFNLMIKTLIIK